MKIIYYGLITLKKIFMSTVQNFQQVVMLLIIIMKLVSSQKIQFYLQYATKKEYI